MLLRSRRGQPEPEPEPEPEPAPEPQPEPEPEMGSYCERCSAQPAAPTLAADPPARCCLPVCAFDCVDSRATARAAAIVERMLENTESAVLARLAAAGCSIAVIGHKQVTSDMPPHHFLKGLQASLGARSYDVRPRPPPPSQPHE